MSETETRWNLGEAAMSYRGFAHGCRGASMFFALEAQGMGYGRKRALSELVLGSIEALEAVRPLRHPVPARNDDSNGSLVWFLDLIEHVCRLVPMPRPQAACCLYRTGQAAWCVLPASFSAHRPLLAFIHLLIGLANGERFDAQAVTAAFLSIQRAAFRHFNHAMLVQAAYDLNIPVQELPGGPALFGLGRRSLIMDGTSTERTSSIGVKFARNKGATSQMLARAGLPVARQIVADSLDGALSAASQIGYPVVVKPSSQDGGRGVIAQIRSADELRDAYGGACDGAEPVIVEQHVDGRDYRVVIVNGQAVDVFERQHCSVVGDGVQSVAELVAIENRDPARGSGLHFDLLPIDLNAEADRMLAHQELTRDSIPDAGRRVRLRSIANIGHGGRGVRCQIHPENVHLARRAAETLRLDYAGIDLLLTDGAMPWREAGGVICEVNAFPESTATLSEPHRRALRAQFPDAQTVPVVAVLGAGGASALARTIAEKRAQGGLVVGLQDDRGVRAGDEIIAYRRVSCFSAGQQLALNRTVDAIILGNCDLSLLDDGLPVPAVDLLVLTGEAPRGLDDHEAIPVTTGHLARLFTLILPACRKIVRVRGGDMDTRMAEALTQLGLSIPEIDGEALDAEIASL